MRTGTGDEVAARAKHLQAAKIDLLVSSQSSADGSAILCEGGWIKNDGVELAAGSFQFAQGVEAVRHSERHVGESVQASVSLSAFQCRGRKVDGFHVGAAGSHGERKGSVVSETIERVSVGIGSRSAIVLPLVQEGTGLLPMEQVKLELQAIHFGQQGGRNLPVKHRNGLRQSFVQPDAGIISLQDASWREQLHQNAGDFRFQTLRSLTESLQDKNVGISIHDKGRQQIAFGIAEAEDFGVADPRFATSGRTADTLLQKGPVYGDVFAGKHAQRDLRTVAVESAAHEAALFIVNADHIARSGRSRADIAAVDPGVAGANPAQSPSGDGNLWFGHGVLRMQLAHRLAACGSGHSDNTEPRGLPPNRLMKPADFDYQLLRDRIAQHPAEPRDSSRMLVLNRQPQGWQDGSFRDFPGLLRGDELLVANNTRVIPARLFGRRAGLKSSPPGKHGHTQKEHLRATIEVLLTRQTGEDTWQGLVRPGRKVPVGERIIFGDGELHGEVLGRGERGLRELRFRCEGRFADVIERLGHVPLPPYIERTDERADRVNYQTIFARAAGAVAAPTAGLHFTPAILERLRSRGIGICDLTLHVGLGTFQPIHEANIEQHRMHEEWYQIPEETAERIRQAKREGRPVLAVGTTVVRALEDAAQRAMDSSTGNLATGPGEATIFIRPGHTFRVVDQMLTNFHLPRSTLLVMVSAFAGRDLVLKAYSHALCSGYRFYSYGDCMLIR